MSEQAKDSTTQSTELQDSWERRLKALDERLHASGHTVVVKEPSDSTEFVATFPQGKRPAARRQDRSPKT